MSPSLCAVLAVLSVFDYPAPHPQHEALKVQFVAASRARDAAAMADAAGKGAALLPEDPVWAYNNACALARTGKTAEALDALERAIRLGFRDTEAIAADSDLKSLAAESRFEELVALSDDLRGQPVLFGPLSVVAATGVFGSTVALGEQNLSWNLEHGCFDAHISLEAGAAGGNAGDLYFNRDRMHSVLKIEDFPGITQIMLDAECRSHGIDLDFPNMAFPYPVFGNCSRALVTGPMWRSIPRALVTTDARRLGEMQRFYLSNQVWVFPAVYDCPPAGTNGDVFASVTPYWIATQGKSWSDQYYLRAALEVSRSLTPAAKHSIVSKGLLAPTIQALLRKSLKGVENEEDYLTAKAHPTAFPADGLDMDRLKAAAAALTPETVPPLALIGGVAAAKFEGAQPEIPELLYAGPCACALVLRAADEKRAFAIAAAGAGEFAFSVVHDDLGAATVEKTSQNTARLVLDRTRMSPTNRVDVAVFGRNEGTGWGAPSFASFAVVDPSAQYSDPFLSPSVEKPAEAKGE